ncbi:18052_t:CDS:2, partial [Dentiscutata erythropus]
SELRKTGLLCPLCETHTEFLKENKRLKEKFEAELRKKGYMVENEPNPDIIDLIYSDNDKDTIAYHRETPEFKIYTRFKYRTEKSVGFDTIERVYFVLNEYYDDRYGFIITTTRFSTNAVKTLEKIKHADITLCNGEEDAINEIEKKRQEFI